MFRFGIYPNIKCGKKVTSSTWDQDKVTTAALIALVDFRVGFLADFLVDFWYTYKFKILYFSISHKNR